MLRKIKAVLELSSETNKVVLKNYLTKKVLLEGKKLSDYIQKNFSGVRIHGTWKGYVVLNHGSTQVVIWWEKLADAHQRANR